MTDSNVVLSGERSSEQPSSINTSLMERLRAGHSEAWPRLVGLFGPLVYRWCRQRELQAADADDVSQNVFRTVAAKIGQFRRDRAADTFRGWLWTIVRSKIADHYRCQDKQQPAPGGSSAHEKLEKLPAPDGQVPDEASAPETPGSLYRRGLELIQSEFTGQTWKAFWRVVVDDCKAAEVADELKMSVNAVYLSKSRVLRRLREELGAVSLAALGRMNTEEAEGFLLSLRGVSRKVAKCVLMYSLDREVLPVDVHVHRVSSRLGMKVKRRPDTSQELIEGVIPPKLRYCYHVNAVAHGRAVCRPRSPRCSDCCIRELCDSGSRPVDTES